MSNKLKILIILLVLVSGVRLLFAAWDWYDRSSHSPAQAQAKAKVQLYKTPAEKPFIEISPEARVRLLEKLKKIKVEDTVESVLAQLGSPQTDPSAISPTESIPISVGSRILIYQIRKQRPNEFDEANDEHIYIFLDGDNQVAQIYTKLRQP